MLAPRFRHQLTNPSSYKLLEFPAHFSSLLQFHPHFLLSHPLFSVPLLQLQSPQQNAPSREDLSFQADPGKREILLPHPHPPTQRGFMMSSGRQHHLHIFPTPSQPSAFKLPQGQFFSFPLQIFADHYRLWSHPGCHLAKQNSGRRDRREGQVEGGRVRWEPGEHSAHHDKGTTKPRLGLAN